MACTCSHEPAPQKPNSKFRTALWIALFINLAMFFVELIRAGRPGRRGACWRASSVAGAFRRGAGPGPRAAIQPTRFHRRCARQSLDRWLRSAAFARPAVPRAGSSAIAGAGLPGVRGYPQRPGVGRRTSPSGRGRNAQEARQRARSYQLESGQEIPRAYTLIRTIVRIFRWRRAVYSTPDTP